MRNYIIGFIIGVVAVSCVWGGVCFGLSRGYVKSKEELNTLKKSYIELKNGNIELRRINERFEKSLREYETRLTEREGRIRELETLIKRLEQASGRADVTIEDIGGILREIEQIVEKY